ncbi:MAG: metallophosphoesterase [Nanoarchaeota archaeon]
MQNSKPKYLLIDKCIFFKEKGILAVGDLHLGYEHMLKNLGVDFPLKEKKELKEGFENLFKEIEKRKLQIKILVFLGDIKHSFGFEWKEKHSFNEILKFIKEKLPNTKIIFIKGNHDTIDFSYGKMKNYYIKEDIAFLHGHESFPEIFDNKIKTLVLGHLHPSIILIDKHTSRKEKYKCYLIGKYKSKKIIILPSFLTTIEGQTINNLEYEYKNFFSILPKKELRNFEVFVVENREILKFGKIKNLR